MKIISTGTHAKIDYLAGLFFMASPWIFQFKDTMEATWVMIAAGLAALIISLFTDYEGGMVRSIPMRVHLTFDIFSGALLASSPWLFGFADSVFLPLLIMGLFEVGAALMTSAHPATDHPSPTVEPGTEPNAGRPTAL